MATSYNDRTKINATSTTFYLLGIVIPSILLIIFLPSTSEYPIGQLNPNGYVKIAITTSIISLVCGFVSAIFTVPKIKCNTPQKKNRFSIKKLFKNSLKSFKNKRLKKIIWGYVMTSIATVFLCSVGLHFFTYSFFYTSKQITVLLLCLLMGTIISQPFWVFLSKKKRKKPALVSGIILTILSVFAIITVYIFRISLYEVSFYLMSLLTFICGIGSGSMYTLPVSLYGDAIDMISKGSDNSTATYGGTLTFASNIANSITQLIVGVLLDVIKFDSSLEVQTLGVQTGLALIVFIGVQGSLILGCLIFASYRELKKSNKV
jgi:Na+/melibiose symporter-like transporter